MKNFTFLFFIAFACVFSFKMNAEDVVELPELQQKCDSAFEVGDYAVVLMLCPEIREQQDLPYLLSYEAISNAELGNISEALDKIVELVDVTNLNADAYEAVTRVADKDLNLTTKRLRTEQQEDNLNPVWPETLGLIYAYYSLYNQAIDCYLQALSLNPDNDADAETLAMLHNQLRQYREALYYADLALQINPYDNGHVETRAIVLRNAGRVDDAVKYLDNMIALDADYAPYYLWRGMVLNSDGDYGRAADDFNKALLIDSVGNEAKLRLAISEFDMGNRERAMSLFRQVRKSSSDAWSGNAIAAAYLGEKDVVDAYKEHVLALRNKANNYFTLAVLADIEGDAATAMDYIQRAISMNVLNPDLVGYDPNLRNIKKLAAYNKIVGK